MLYKCTPECGNLAEPNIGLLTYLDQDSITNSSVEDSFNPLGPVHFTCTSAGVVTTIIHSTMQVRQMAEPVGIGLAKLESNLKNRWSY